MNPFSFGTVVRGDSFYDRKEETALLTSTLSGGNNIVLFAPRRYGKTSLVFRVMELLEEKGVTCLYIDMMAAYSLESLAELYVNAIKAKQGRVENLAKKLASWVKSIRPTMNFGPDGSPKLSIDFVNGEADLGTLSEIFDLPSHIAAKGKQVVVVIDEFQEITRFNKYGIEGLLRSVIQRQENVCYLFLGSKTHLMSQMFDNKKRPFYNSALHVQIGPLPEDDTISFLKERFGHDGIIIGEEQCRYLIKCASNIPYYIQLLASVLWQRMAGCGQTIAKDDIDRCVEDIIVLKGDYYYELFDKYSERQKKLMEALSIDGKNVFSTKYLQKHKLGSSSTVQKSLATLVEDGIVERDSDTYFISDPFFRQFITNSLR